MILCLAIFDHPLFCEILIIYKDEFRLKWGYFDHPEGFEKYMEVPYLVHLATKKIL